MTNNAMRKIHYPIQSDNLDTQVNATLSLLDDFGALMEQETAAIKAFDSKTINNLQNQKVHMGHLYHDAMMALGDRNEEMKAQLSDAKKEQIKAAYYKIHDIFNRNLRALEAVQEASKRMQKLIIDAANAAVAEDRPTYSASGKSYVSDAQPVHMGTNETV